MPVPLPSAENVDREKPDAAETQVMADGVASAIAGRQGLLPVQRSLIEALFPAMTGHHVTLESRPAMTATGSPRRWHAVSSRSAPAWCR